MKNDEQMFDTKCVITDLPQLSEAARETSKTTTRAVKRSVKTKVKNCRF
jgi:hypothetical protein